MEGKEDSERKEGQGREGREKEGYQEHLVKRKNHLPKDQGQREIDNK